MPTRTRSANSQVNPKAIPGENWPGCSATNLIQQHTPPEDVARPLARTREHVPVLRVGCHSHASVALQPPVSLLCTPWTPSLSIGLANPPPLANPYPVPQSVRILHTQPLISINGYLSKDELEWNEAMAIEDPLLIGLLHSQVPAIPGIDPHHLLPIQEDPGDIQRCWHPDCTAQDLALDRDDVPALRRHFLGDRALHQEVHEACDANLPIPCIFADDDGKHCGQKFASVDWFLQHVQKHLAAPAPMCPLCNMELQDERSIVQHYWNWPTTECPVFWKMLVDAHGVDRVRFSESEGPGRPKRYPVWLS